MDITDGKLSYSIGLDYGQVDDAREELVKQFQEIGMSAEEAGEKADEAMKLIAESISQALHEVDTEAEALDVLKTALAEMQQQLSSMDDGEAKVMLQGVVDGFESVINEMEEAIEKNGELGESFSSVSDIMIKLLGGQENYNKIISQLPEPLKAAISGIQGMVGAAKAFIATPLGATIAAIVLALQAMRTWLNSSVEGQLRMAEITGYLQGVLGQLKEIVIAVGKALYKAFTDPKKAIKDLWEALRTNIVNRLKGIGDMAAALGKILKSAFTLDFEGVKKGVAELGESFLQFTSGIDNLPEKFRKNIKQIGDAAKEQAAINRERKELEIAESEFNIRRAELNKLMNESRAKIWDNKASKAEQKKALEDYKKYNDELLKTEEGFIDKKIALQEREMALTTNGIQEENTLRDLQAQKLNKQAEAAQRMLMLTRMGNRVDSGIRTDANAQLQAEKQIANELTKLRQSNEAKRVELIRDGYAKQIAAAKLAYETELKEISRVEEAWKKANGGALTKEQSKETEEARKLAAEQWQKTNAEALDAMLKDYQSYEQRIADIEQEYVNTIGYIRAEAYKTDEQGKFIHNEEEILGYEQAIAAAVRKQAEERLNLNLESIDTTAYASIEEKMDAINDAYATYIDNLVKAGASVAEINAAIREQNELTGKTATLSAQLKDLESTKQIAAESGDIEEVKRLNEEIRKLKKELEDLEKTSDKKTIGTMFKEWAQELKASDLINAGGQLGDVIANIGEAAENKAVAGFGQALSFAGDIGAKIASGDYLGAALSIITEIGNAIAEDIAKVKAFEKANEQAAQTANQINIDNLLGGENGIFGDNAVRQLANYLEAVDKAGKAINNLGLNATKNFKVLDRSAFANFFGGSDQYSSLGDFARKNGMDLLDAYGNINAQVLDLFKNTYEDLSDADKQWIDNAIAYTDQYAEAMEGLASYLQSIFGNTVDTIVDQIFEGSVDIHAITSELGKTMAKDLMQSLIMAAYFDDLEETFKKILQDEGGMTESAMMQIYAMWSDRMAQFNEQLPMWEEMRDKWAQTLDFDTEAASIGAGTALASASQESIDLLNGQLNAMRTVQIRMDNRIGDILLEMRGFRGDMNDFHGDTNDKLDQIINNTASGGGNGRALGAYA